MNGGALAAASRVVDQHISSNGVIRSGVNSPRESNGSKVMSSSFASLGLSAALLGQNNFISSPNQISP